MKSPNSWIAPFLSLTLALALALAPVLSPPAWGGEEIRRSFEEDGTRRFSTESKTDSKGTLSVMLEFREQETLLVVCLSRYGEETAYDGISIVPRDQAGRPLALKRKSMMSKTYHTVVGIVFEEYGTYLMTEKEAVRMFSVEVIRNGEATSFELHLVR